MDDAEVDRVAEERASIARLRDAAERQAAARERRQWSSQHYRRARGQRLLSMQSRWRARSAVYDRFGHVLAMAGHAGPVGGDGSRHRSARPTRVLLVDPDVPTRVGVRMILSAVDGVAVVGEAPSGEDAIAQALALQPDLVITGIRLPGMDGITATERITAALGERTTVVVLTSHDAEEYELRARRAGARAFISKRAGTDEFIAAVLAVTAPVELLEPGSTPISSAARSATRRRR